uniref:Uncharacterized protein n=1 Tax=Equus asinus TaxID=9793 RepID=A0A8C4MFM9_EQUAS
MHSEDMQEIVQEKIWQKRQVKSFPFLPGRSAGGPRKGLLYLWPQFPEMWRSLNSPASGEKSPNILHTTGIYAF